MILVIGGSDRRSDGDRALTQPLQVRDTIDAGPSRSVARVALPVLAVLALAGFGPQLWRSTLTPRGADGPGPSEASRPYIPAAALAARTAVSVAVSAPRYRIDDREAIDPVRLEPARTDPLAGSREDRLSVGDFAVSEAPYLRIIASEGQASPTSLFVTIARRAADGQGLAVVKTGERGLIETKFGPVETLDVTLSGGTSSGAVTRICTGFSNAGQIGLAPVTPRLDGWLCAPLGQPPEPRSLACTLDKLALNGQASADLDAAYRGFEARRSQACGSAVTDGPKREPAAITGAISKMRSRYNEAKLRQIAEARP